MWGVFKQINSYDLIVSLQESMLQWILWKVWLATTFSFGRYINTGVLSYHSLQQLLSKSVLIVITPPVVQLTHVDLMLPSLFLCAQKNICQAQKLSSVVPKVTAVQCCTAAKFKLREKFIIVSSVCLIWSSLFMVCTWAHVHTLYIPRAIEPYLLICIIT